MIPSISDGVNAAQDAQLFRVWGISCRKHAVLRKQEPGSPRIGNRQHSKDFLDTCFRQYDGFGAGLLPQT